MGESFRAGTFQPGMRRGTRRYPYRSSVTMRKITRREESSPSSSTAGPSDKESPRSGLQPGIAQGRGARANARLR
jgi:hypothetical protein